MKKSPKKAVRFRAERFCRTTLAGVVTYDKLADLLRRAGQDEWTSRVRLCGLLLVVDFLRRKRTPQGVPISADLAHDFISAVKRPKKRGTIREPLAVLCRVGILRCVQAAINGRDLKMAARYSIDGGNLNADERQRLITLEVNVPHYLIEKRESATERRERRCNLRYPFRRQLKVDLHKLRFSDDARERIAHLLGDPQIGPAAKRAVEAIDGGKYLLTISPCGQVTTSAGLCPKVLKPYFLLDREATVSCDISHAHHCFLPALLGERIDYLKKDHRSVAEIEDSEAELKRLSEFLSDGDYYAKLCVNTEDQKEREQKKRLVNVLLNLPNAKSERIGLYLRLRQEFPRTLKVCEDIKRKDHRNISKRLQSLTAKVINAALLQAQHLGIAAIPDVDAIICSKRYKETVCALIGAKVHEISHGVCCKVGGIRFNPSQSPMGSSAQPPQRSEIYSPQGSKNAPTVHFE